MRVRLGLAASYAAAVEYGTAPHEIRPVNGAVLAFEVAGKMIFTPLVHHPGLGLIRLCSGLWMRRWVRLIRFLLICGLSWWVAKHDKVL